MRRETVWTLKQLLADLIAVSSDHPGGYIDGETAEIALVSSMSGPPKIVVSWDDGFKDDDERERYAKRKSGS